MTECSLTSCVRARFLISSHTKPGQWHSQPTPTSLGQGPFTCHCGHTGVERTPNKSQHTKLTLEKKILPPLMPGSSYKLCHISRVSCHTSRTICHLLRTTPSVTYMSLVPGHIPYHTACTSHTTLPVTY